MKQYDFVATSWIDDFKKRINDKAGEGWTLYTIQVVHNEWVAIFEREVEVEQPHQGEAPRKRNNT